MSAPSSKPDDASASRPSRPSAKPSTANSSSPPARHPLLFSSHDRYQSQPADRIRIVSPCPLPGWAITVQEVLLDLLPSQPVRIGSGRALRLEQDDRADIFAGLLLLCFCRLFQRVLTVQRSPNGLDP